ncbi:hypothetical protein [Cupriavidus sp. H18C1]|uniref:hypothetical protein n=1 Tax=Cupriavidus sp. H18C1 TaxID=3241601 RepID=UPI003BB90632
MGAAGADAAAGAEAWPAAPADDDAWRGCGLGANRSGQTWNSSAYSGKAPMPITMAPTHQVARPRSASTSFGVFMRSASLAP